MARVVWTEPALEYLDEIADYIALDNMIAAKKLVKNTLKSVKRLSKFPESGRYIPEIKSRLYREIIIGPCRVFYRAEPKKVFILHVLRGERQLRNYLLEERESKNC